MHTTSQRWRGAVTASVIAVIAAVASALAPTATAAPPGPPIPIEFQLDRYTPVKPDRFRSLAYVDDGRSFVRVGNWTCQFTRYRYVGCKGAPATAPPGTLGVTITADQQGPYWVQNRFLYSPSYRFGSKAGFRAPTLAVGHRVTIMGTTCTAPRPNVVACLTGSRAFILTPAWHKFFFPSGDTAHNNNPAPRYLPPRLQYWNQLPV